jgi:hypothetical protein
VKHNQPPLQPIVLDDGKARFVSNKVIVWMMEELRRKGTTLNDYPFEVFPIADIEQFYQLIGYSISGFGELSVVTTETFDRAERKAATAKSRLTK